MRPTHRLTAASVKAITEPGYYLDGVGLYLQVAQGGTKSWVYRYGLHGRTRDMGLGPFPTVTLAEAREKASDARKLKAGGIDPLGDKQRALRIVREREDRRMSFADATAHYIDLKKEGWSDSNVTAWIGSMAKHAHPVLGALDVSEIDSTHILRTLEPIWTAKHATAALLRGRIEAVLDWAKSSGRHEGENPARWKGHLENLLPAVNDDPKHRASLPWQEMPEFVAKLRAESGTLARLMELIVLTGVRAGEASGVVWNEFDVEARTWRIPKERMKGGRKAHDVPLSSAALRLLASLPGFRERQPDALVFPSATGKPYWDADLAGLLRRLGYAQGTVTTHGSRSSLRTWLTEHLHTDVDVAESVLAHDRRGGVQRAYERTRHFETRVPLMQAWADFLAEPKAKVFPLRSKRK
jgi:integrase